MNTELIKMCDCPEIQDRWEPKVGDMVVCDYGLGFISRIDTASYKLDNNKFPISAWYFMKERYGHRYIPRIEDVLEWLNGHLYLTLGYCDTWSISKSVGSMQNQYGYTLIEALLRAYMHLEHNKTWNGEAWA